MNPPGDRGILSERRYAMGETILDKIVATKREEVAEARRRRPLAEVRARVADAPPPRDFRTAIVHAGEVRLIAEVKKASPSKGIIRSDFDPVAIARSYVAGGAAALSVLTDAQYFQGSLEIFAQVRAAVDLPMLRKEFMIAPYQFYEARAAGADAVLLITSILSSAELRDFHALALELRMTPLVETHSAEDLERVLSEIEPALLGINNRDLSHPQFHTTLEHADRMLPLARAALGAGRALPPIVSESGIHTAEDVAHLASLGVSAVLVGESLMRQPDPGLAARELMARRQWERPIA